MTSDVFLLVTWNLRSNQFFFQILAKRYECSDVPSFVRKIYIARDKADKPRVNTHVAVLTYHWKSEPVIARANRVSSRWIRGIKLLPRIVCVVSPTFQDALIARKRLAENGEAVVVEGRAALENNNLEHFRMKRPASMSRFKVRAGQIVRPKALR